MHDQCAAGWQGGVGLGQQPAFLLQVPIVQDVAHDQHVGARQRVLEEVPRLETDAVGDALLADVLQTSVRPAQTAR